MELLARRVAGEAKPPYEIKERTLLIKILSTIIKNKKSKS